MAGPAVNYKSRVVSRCDGCGRQFSEPAIQGKAPFGADGKPLEPVHCDRCEEKAIIEHEAHGEEGAVTADRVEAMSQALLDLVNEIARLENDLRKEKKSLFVNRKNLETAYTNARMLVLEERED